VIVGSAFLSKAVSGYCYEENVGKALYRIALRETWKFTDEESELINGDKRAFLAIPIVKADQVCGIIYLDSPDISIADLDEDFTNRAVGASELLEPLL
jgi:hypothetical protein